MNTTAQATLALADITPSTGPAFSVRDVKDYPVADLPTPPENRRPGGEFLDLIRSTNLVMPLVVIEVDGKFIVKDGLKRLWACLLTDRKTVDLKVVTVNSVRGAVLGLVLNEARSENAIAEANMICELIHAGADQALVQQATGMPLSRIRKRLELLKLTPELFQLLEGGKIRASVAARAAKLDRSEQRRAAAIFRKTQKLTHTDVTDIRHISTKAATAALPAEMFAPETAAGVATSPDAWKITVRQLLETALATVPAAKKQLRKRLASVAAAV